MPARLEGKVAIVTGAARGLGLAIAQRLAADGARVLGADLRDEEGRRAFAEIGAGARYAPLDVRSPDEWRAAVDFCAAELGRPNVLVNNAGVLCAGPIEEITSEQFRLSFEVHMLGPLLGIQAVIPAMQAAGGGSIINVSSAQGLQGMRNLTPYVSTKFGLTGLTRNAAIELGPRGIRVNALHPGPIDTAMRGGSSESAAGRGSFFSALPLRRSSQPAEIAAAVAFLASDDASYATGGSFVFDGGQLAGPMNA